MNPHDLIKIASFLATIGVVSNLGRPRQADLRRAVSAAYYALFHALAHCGADMLAGSSSARRNQAGWQRIYRSLEHGATRSRLNNRSGMRGFSGEIQDFGRLFVNLQVQRHRVDYDPTASFDRATVLLLVSQAEQHIIALENAAPADRRDFAIYVLFRDR